MKCPKCGFENRPEARFCKGCGQPLEAPAPAPPGEVQCPSCGAPNKPTARFCVRCGASLAAPAPAPPAPPGPPVPPPAAPPTYGPPTPPPAAPPTYGPPTPPPAAPPTYGPPVPPPAAPPTYGSPTPPPAAPPGPPVPPPTAPAYGPPIPPVPPAVPPYGLPEEMEMAPPSAPAGGFPRWLLIALPIALVLCLAALVGLGFWAYRAGKLPFLSPAPTETATPIPTSVPSPETSAPVETPSPTPPAPVEIAPSAPELKVGETFTLTVTVTNTGDRPWSQTEYDLLGEWEPVLELAGQPEPSSEELPAGQSRQVDFTFTARQEGTATLKVLIRMRMGGDRPRWDMLVSEEVQVNVRP